MAIPPVEAPGGVDPKLATLLDAAIDILSDDAIEPRYAMDGGDIESIEYEGTRDGADIHVSAHARGFVDLRMTSPSTEEDVPGWSIWLLVEADDRWPGISSCMRPSLRGRLRHVRDILSRIGRQKPHALMLPQIAWATVLDVASAWAAQSGTGVIRLVAGGPSGDPVFESGGEAVRGPTAEWIAGRMPAILTLKEANSGSWSLRRKTLVCHSEELACDVVEAMRTMTKRPEAFR